MATKRQPKEQTTGAPVSQPAASSTLETAVITDLITRGYSLQQAQAMLAGNGEVEEQEDAPAPKAQAKPKKTDIPQSVIDGDEDIDPASIQDPGDGAKVVEFSHEPEKGLTSIESLYALRKRLGEDKDKKRYRFTVELDHRVMDWVVYAAIAEAQSRRNANMTINDFIVQKIKEVKATDPTEGGRRQAQSSGLKDAFNPTTKSWS